MAVERHSRTSDSSTGVSTIGLSLVGFLFFLDYILQSHEYGAQLENSNDVFIPRDSNKDLWQKWDLSDHFPVRTHLRQ